MTVEQIVVLAVKQIVVVTVKQIVMLTVEQIVVLTVKQIVMFQALKLLPLASNYFFLHRWRDRFQFSHCLAHTM